MTHPEIADQASRPAWIALACDGPVLALGDAVHAVPEAAAFLALLGAARPRIAVIAEPPAPPEVFDHLVDERRRRPRFRIVHLTSDSAIDARLRALRLGFDEALPATIAPSELLARLTLLDERAHPRNGTTVAVGDDLELDLLAHQLRRDGRPVHLRPKEYGLLALLAAHPGRAYTRQQLLDRVWGADRDGDPRTVDVHVRWLRAKVEADPARPVHLVTLRGIGYRLDPPDR